MLTNETVIIHFGGFMRRVFRKYNENGEVRETREYYFCGIKYKEKSETRREGIVDRFKRVWGATESA